MPSLLMSILTTRPIEDLLGWLLSNKRAHDAGLLTRHATISPTPQSITVTCAAIGPSGSKMPAEYASSEIGGANKIPSLSWSVPEDVRSKVKEWVLVSEDPDAPMAEPIVHGIYFGIPAGKTSFTPEDFEVTEGSVEMKLKGGFWYGKNRRGTVYIAPRPIARHGVHRYFFEVFGVGEGVDWEGVRREAGQGVVDKSAVLRAVEGKVVGWGEWVGTYERK